MPRGEHPLRNSEEITVDDSELGGTDDGVLDGPAPGHPTPWRTV